MRYAIVDAITRRIFVTSRSAYIIEAMFPAWKTIWGKYQIDVIPGD